MEDQEKPDSYQLVPMELLQFTFNALNLELRSGEGEAELLAKLEAQCAEWINTDFNKLLLVLYRIDVSEKLVRSELARLHTVEPPGRTMARLILERQKQKLLFRKKYSQQSGTE